MIASCVLERSPCAWRARVAIGPNLPWRGLACSTADAHPHIMRRVLPANVDGVKDRLSLIIREVAVEGVETGNFSVEDRIYQVPVGFANVRVCHYSVSDGAT